MKNQTSLPFIDQVSQLVPPTKEPDIFQVARMGHNRITLHRGAYSWFARFSGPEAARIQELFGTVDICTGFTNAADSEEVFTKIAKLNPEYLVVIEDL